MKKKVIKATAISVTAQKMRQAIEKFLQMQREGKNPPPSMIWGAPGTGKSYIVREIAEKASIGFVDVRLAQREPVDMRGLPVPDSARKCVEWYVSGEWPRESGNGGIIFFDEITAADRMNQAAAYELILDRKLGDLYRVPDSWYIYAAGNRASDKAVATAMSSALANRFLHFNLEPDVESWCAWAEGQGIHPAIIGFLKFKTELLHALPDDEACQQGWPSPRSWERVDTIIRNFAADDLLALVSGLVGEAAAIQFLGFMKSAKAFDVDVRRAMLGKGKITFPRESDQLYAWCCSAANLLLGGQQQAESSDLLDGFARILGQVSSDFAQMMLQMVRKELLPNNMIALMGKDGCQALFNGEC